jgi:hypothetical protein
MDVQAEAERLVNENITRRKAEAAEEARQKAQRRERLMIELRQAARGVGSHGHSLRCGCYKVLDHCAECIECMRAVLSCDYSLACAQGIPALERYRDQN